MMMPDAYEIKQEALQMAKEKNLLRSAILLRMASLLDREEAVMNGLLSPDNGPASTPEVIKWRQDSWWKFWRAYDEV